jgi:ATP-binding cassette subfamily B protein
MQQKESKNVAPTGAVVKAYWQHILTYRWYVVISFAAIFFIQAGSVIGPLFLRQLVNMLASGVSADTVRLGMWALVGYTAIQFSVWALWRVEMVSSTQVCAKIMADLSKEAFAYLMHHSYQFFTNSFAGALTRRVNRYSDAFNRLWDSIMTSVLGALLYTLGIIGVLWFQNPLLGSALILAVIFFVSLQWALSRWQQPLRFKRAEEDSNLTAALADAIANQSNVQLFSGNTFEEKGVGAAVDRLLNAYLNTWNFDVFVYGLLGFVSTAINISVLWIAFWLWQRHQLTIGDFVLIQAYIIGLFNNVWGLSREFRNINAAFADAGEMVYIMQQQHGIQNIRGAKELAATAGSIRFKDVSFNFSDRAVLKDFNLTIAGGERVALVGPSGAGKTTVTKLLLRLYDIGQGSIEIDGQNIARVTQDSLRDAIAFVPQEPILFHRTLMENIRYGRRSATDAEVIEAAKQAHCHEFISQLPLKYETYVGERGIKLSGGERQRVAIARAILKNAPILVLDEATSSLDSESEALIQDALETLMRGKTVIVIAHRLSTIMKMDRIIVMEGGAVVAQGTHQELLAQEGLYNKLWSIQAGGFLGGGDPEDSEVQKDEDSLAEEVEER